MNKNLGKNTFYCSSVRYFNRKLMVCSQAIKIFLTASVLLSFFIQTNAQEVLRGLSANPELLKITKNGKTIKAARLKSALLNSDTVNLPFIDDFSSVSVYPDQRLWLDKMAYVNSTFPVDPVSIGVATLDALDENGHLYKNASSSPFYADTLTSRPINLNYQDQDSIYFSFYYQPQGIGDSPEPGDSLLVDFFSPASGLWYNVLSIPGSSLKPFKQVMIHVLPQFLAKGFQFRFRNIASLDASEVLGKHTNVDQWNIDYVRLDKGRNVNDTVISDVAFVKPLTSFLKTFSSMPWSHYLLAFRKELKPSIDITIRNNGPVDLPVNRSFKIREVKPNSTEDGTDAGQNPIAAFTTVTLSATLDKLENPIFSPEGSVGKTIQFDIKSIIGTPAGELHTNDTIYYRQTFSNYFAYDDSSSEAGYGIYGDGSQNAMVAYAFNAYKQDTVNGISFYFNPSENDTTASYHFNLAVWGDNNGVPGQLLYKESGGDRTPKIVPLNQFYNFKLDTGVIVSGKFYVGWIQTEDAFLGIGTDLNNDNHSKLFINLYGSWINSSINGTLMVRPLLGQVNEGPVTGEKPVINETTFSVYPNPAQEIINVQLDSSPGNKPLTANLYSSTGKLMKSDLLTEEENRLDVGNLPDGLYILQINGGKKNYKPMKIMIQR